MWLIIFLCLIQFSPVSDSDSLVDHSKSQAEYYIGEIDNDSNVEENLWALTVLGSEKDELKSYIEENSGTSDVLSIFNNFEDTYQDQLRKVVFQTGSPNLLLALLLTTEEKESKRQIYKEYLSKFDFPTSKEIDYGELSESIINGNQIDDEILSNQKFLLPHFFLLYDQNYSTFLSQTYYDNLKRNWKANFSSGPNLHSSLAEATFLRVLYLQRNFSEIVSLYNSLIDNKLLPNSTLKLRIYQYLNYPVYRLGFYDRNLKIVRNIAIPLSKYLGKEGNELHFTQLQGVYLYRIGKIQQAEKIYQRVLDNVDKQNPQINLSSLYNNLAITYHKLGKYEDFLSVQFKALERAETTNNYSHQLEILNNLFVYYRKSNNPERALNFLRKAQQVAEKTGNNKDLATIYISFGAYYRAFKNNFTKAHNYFYKAEKILDAQENLQHYIHLLNEQAETFETQEIYTQAINKHEEVITLTKKKKGKNYLDALVNKALVNLKIGNLEATANLISEFKSHDINQLAFPQLIKAKTVEADYLHRIGKSQEALDIMESVLNQVIERAKSSADLKSGFWHIEDEYLDAFELTVSIYQNEGQQRLAIQKLDQLKTINDASLYQNPLVKSSLLNESELTQYKKLTEQLDAKRKKLLIASEERQFDIRQSINQLKLKKRKLDQKLTKQFDSETISVREIQSRLSARELVLHITELNDQFYMARISRSNVSINTIPIDSSLSTLLSNSAQQIATNETNLDSLYKITEILNLRNIPDRIEKITIIPDSYFYQLPIDILPMEKPSNSYSYGEATYLIENIRTQYLTSLEGFQSNSNSQSRIKNEISYTGYGVSNFEGYGKKSLVSLPYAQTEVSNIASKLTHFNNVQTFVNEQSTKSVFKKTAPKSQILHLATHSEVSDRDPMFSTIYLNNTGDQKPDSTFNSQIFAYELFELDLSNEMIMLNSCESGSGSYIQGTGVMGMSRALRYAGANSLVLNLWSVNDMLASDFAIHFYDELNKGKSKAKALQATKQYFLKNKNASPHFWGPYMLLGNSDPVVQPNQDENMIMAGTFLFYFLLMIGLSYLSQQNVIFQDDQKKAA